MTADQLPEGTQRGPPGESAARAGRLDDSSAPEEVGHYGRGSPSSRRRGASATRRSKRCPRRSPRSRSSAAPSHGRTQRRLRPTRPHRPRPRGSRHPSSPRSPRLPSPTIGARQAARACGTTRARARPIVASQSPRSRRVAHMQGCSLPSGASLCPPSPIPRPRPPSARIGGCRARRRGSVPTPLYGRSPLPAVARAGGAILPIV